MNQAEMELVKGSRYQRIFPEGYFYEYRQDEVMKRVRKDIEDYYDNSYHTTQESIVNNLMKYNNTRLQYLLKLYYQRRSEKDIYFIYKSAYRVYRLTYGGLPAENFLYKTLWTDIRGFFGLFHTDFASTFRKYFDRNPENFENALNFCGDYFKWLSKELSEKGKVSFEEVEQELKRLLVI